MIDHILDEISAETHDTWVHRYQPCVDRGAALRLSVSGSEHGALRITDLGSAFLPGQTCTRLTVRATDGVLPINLIFRAGSLSALFQQLRELPWEPTGFGFKAQRLTLHDQAIEVERSESKAIRVFSPVHLDRLKPLTARPTKWTVKHAIRALVNRQFEDLRTDGRYTDDYAFDAASDFGKGEITDALAFAQPIYESPSGWWVSERDSRVRLSCHHFDYNSFVFLPEAREAKKAA